MLLGSLEGLQKLILPDHWQAAALAGLKEGKDVIVDAPTGSGKTYVFEKFVENANFSRPALYTVPTRALANDKYAEWRARDWPVGISTGDVTMNLSAPVVVATLEAVQGLLLGAVRFRLLVIDEYQWLSDPMRGNHYEGAMLALPPEVQLLLLSGSVANPEDVASWLGRLGRVAEVVQHRERPVPLEEVDADDLIGGLPASIQGFWSRRVAGALRAGMGPVLVFAPRRQEAERLARQLARELPLSDPLELTSEQESILGPVLTKLVRQRVAFHHSGLSYAQRAGMIEPLAKGGQLRAVVATLGLSAGINFSLRSVLITASSYRFDNLDWEIQPHEILQMIGRAGRRGLDEAGFVLASSQSPPMRRARPQRLRRSASLPWTFFLRALRAGRTASEMAAFMSPRFFTETPIALGTEATSAISPERLPCGQLTDTGRARMVRREKKPFRGCAACEWRPDCLELSPQPTLLWQWTRIGVLDRDLRLTPRGEVVSCFLGPEGLALAAALEEGDYPIDDLIFDLANLFAGERFAGTNPRGLGRLAACSQKAYRRFSIDGYLHYGVPPQYGYGASEIVRRIVEGSARRSELTQEFAGRGDIDRLLTEWRSLLRQIAAAPSIAVERWAELQERAARLAAQGRSDSLPDLPPLTAEQRRPVSHRFFRAGR